MNREDTARCTYHSGDKPSGLCLRNTCTRLRLQGHDGLHVVQQALYSTIQYDADKTLYRMDKVIYSVRNTGSHVHRDMAEQTQNITGRPKGYRMIHIKQKNCPL